MDAILPISGGWSLGRFPRGADVSLAGGRESEPLAATGRAAVPLLTVLSRLEGLCDRLDEMSCRPPTELLAQAPPDGDRTSLATARARSRRLVAFARQWRQRHTELAARLGAAERRVALLDWHDRTGEAAHETSSSGELATLRAGLMEKTAEVHRRLAELAEEQAACEDETARIRQVHEQQSADLQCERELLDRREADLAEERRSLASEQQALRGVRHALADEHQALAAERHVLAAERVALAADRQKWADDRAAPVQAVAASTASRTGHEPRIPALPTDPSLPTSTRDRLSESLSTELEQKFRDLAEASARAAVKQFDDERTGLISPMLAGTTLCLAAALVWLGVTQTRLGLNPGWVALIVLAALVGQGCYLVRRAWKSKFQWPFAAGEDEDEAEPEEGV